MLSIHDVLEFLCRNDVEYLLSDDSIRERIIYWLKEAVCYQLPLEGVWDDQRVQKWIMVDIISSVFCV